MPEPYHIPVMLSEVLHFLDVKENGTYIDCTLGGGGHSRAILERGANVIALDRDPEAVSEASGALSVYGERVRIYNAKFSGLAEIIKKDVSEVDGVLMDLGLSSRMIDDPARGFSFQKEGPLLMTMDRESETAGEVLNSRNENELAFIFREYGEEHHASRIARAIVSARKTKPLRTTTDLASIIEKTVGGRSPQKSKARIFQALRIYVNDELEELREGLDSALEILKKRGRLCAISYHSLEDRTVKHFIREKSISCICDPGIPQCKCDIKPLVKPITRKSVVPSEKEIETNPRARSARLRACEKI